MHQFLGWDRWDRSPQSGKNQTDKRLKFQLNTSWHFCWNPKIPVDISVESCTYKCSSLWLSHANKNLFWKFKFEFLLTWKFKLEFLLNLNVSVWTFVNLMVIQVGIWILKISVGILQSVEWFCIIIVMHQHVCWSWDVCPRCVSTIIDVCLQCLTFPESPLETFRMTVDSGKNYISPPPKGMDECPPEGKHFFTKHTIFKPPCCSAKHCQSVRSSDCREVISFYSEQMVRSTVKWLSDP